MGRNRTSQTTKKNIGSKNMTQEAANKPNIQQPSELVRLNEAANKPNIQQPSELVRLNEAANKPNIQQPSELVRLNEAGILNHSSQPTPSIANCVESEARRRPLSDR
jgi:hypothetical protein